MAFCALFSNWLGSQFMDCIQAGRPRYLLLWRISLICCPKAIKKSFSFADARMETLFFLFFFFRLWGNRFSWTNCRWSWRLEDRRGRPATKVDLTPAQFLLLRLLPSAKPNFTTGFTFSVYCRELSRPAKSMSHFSPLTHILKPISDVALPLTHKLKIR